MPILSKDNIDFVNNLLIEAGNLALAMQDNLQDHTLAELTIDQQISQLLVSKLQERFKNETIISEEALPEHTFLDHRLTWLIDPIDGTHHYLAKDMEYAVMVGLLIEGQPIYGWVYIPETSILYYGGPEIGVWRLKKSNANSQLIPPKELKDSQTIRLLVGRRDNKHNPWLTDVPNTTVIQAGSIGYKLAKILEDEADMLIHLAGRLKVWDTAGPVALALAAGFDVGNDQANKLLYPLDSFTHSSAIVIGKQGSWNWFNSNILSEHSR